MNRLQCLCFVVVRFCYDYLSFKNFGFLWCSLYQISVQLLCSLDKKIFDIVAAFLGKNFGPLGCVLSLIFISFIFNILSKNIYWELPNLICDLIYFLQFLGISDELDYDDK